LEGSGLQFVAVCAAGQLFITGISNTND